MKKTNLNYLSSTLLIALSVFILTSCGSGSGQNAGEGAGENETEDTTAAPSDEAMADDQEVTSWTKNGLTVSVVQDNPQFNDAILELNVPAQEDQLESGAPVEFAFNVTNYKLGNQTPDADSKMCANSAKGQHIHLILNNEPYTAHYESQFNKDLEDGNYVALAFLSRSYHMSIKQPDAYLIREFTVGAPAETMDFDETAPHLFYSRPKGEYVGEDTKKILLDFYVVNADLSPEGYKVRATINDTEFILDSWEPYYVEGLPIGENTFKLEFLDVNGAPVKSPFNPVERTITLSDLN